MVMIRTPGLEIPGSRKTQNKCNQMELSSVIGQTNLSMVAIIMTAIQATRGAMASADQNSPRIFRQRTLRFEENLLMVLNN